jgi:hypothetical protein
VSAASTVEGLERGVSGTEHTIEKMHSLVQRAKLDPTIQKIAYLLRSRNSQDLRGSGPQTADAIHNWVQRHGLFTRDPFQIEKIEDLVASMKPIIDARRAGVARGHALFTGDCDTYAMWVAALGGVLGFNYAFETVKVDADRPDEFSHVYTALRVGDDWYPLDPSTRNARPGWRPPVSEDRLRRWPEQPIENVVTEGDMKRINGGMLGDGEPYGVDEGFRDSESPMEENDAQYAADYIGYGIPKDFGPGGGDMPEADFSDIHLLPPGQPQPSVASMEPDMEALQAAPLIDPSHRIEHIATQPDDHGNPYRRGGRQPYYKMMRQAYPPGSPWNGQLGVDTTKFPKKGPYIQVQEPGTPERKVEVRMNQPMMLRRRNVMTVPQQIPYGVMEGMGDIDPETGILTFGSTPTPTVAPTPTASTNTTTQAAATAGKSVWDSVSDIAGSIFKAAGSIVPATMQQKTAELIARATNKVAGAPVVGVQTSSPFYKSPFFWGAAALVVGGGAYVVMKNKGGGRRRRR